MKPSSRIIVTVAGSVLLILLLNTCGIEQYLQLQPPSDPTNIGDLFTFKKTLFNSETEFIGFDLYYRIYNLLEDPDLDEIIEFEDLGANGFSRIHASDDVEANIQRPLIRIQPNDRTPAASPPDNDEFTLTVDFSGTSPLVEPFPIIFDDGTSTLIDSPEDDSLALPGPPPILIEITDIRRDVYDDSDDSYKQFSDFSEGDADIDTDIWDDIDLGLDVKIVLYVVCYGYDFVNFRSLYSEPVKLGTIERTFP